jgi:predicted nucleotidyltransferase
MVPQSQIKAVVLYGSHARGDANHDSDKDVCVFTQKYTPVDEIQLTSLLPVLGDTTLSLATYCQNDLTAMLEYGSLFLWHIKLEGRIVHGKDYLAPQLERLTPFQRHHAEIVYHAEIFDDLLNATTTPCTANEFDLSLLFTIVRNTCMILAHKAGVHVFGRLACYHVAAQMFHDLPLDETTYLKLSMWKSVYERGADAQRTLPSTKEMSRLMTQVQRLLEYADANTR